MHYSSIYRSFNETEAGLRSWPSLSNLSASSWLPGSLGWFFGPGITFRRKRPRLFSFYLARWRRDYNPDQRFICSSDDCSLPVLADFSQYWLIIYWRLTESCNSDCNKQQAQHSFVNYILAAAKKEYISAATGQQQTVWGVQKLQNNSWIAWMKPKSKSGSTLFQALQQKGLRSIEEAGCNQASCAEQTVHRPQPHNSSHLKSVKD